jgi:hypothetical protein
MSDPHDRPLKQRRHAWIAIACGSAALVLLAVPVVRAVSIPLGIAGWVLANRASAGAPGLARIGKGLSIASIVVTGMLLLFLATAISNHY